MRLKLTLQSLIDQHGIPNVLEWIDELAFEWVDCQGKSDFPQALALHKAIEQATTLAEEIDNTDLVPQK